MGSCMSSQKQKGNLEYFRKDINLLDKSQIFNPLFTTLFNTLRRFKEIFVVFSDPLKAKQFSGIALQDIMALQPKNIKISYSFKKMVIVGTYSKIQSQLQQLNRYASITSMYVVSQKLFEKFQKQFPLFNSFDENNLLTTGRIPILVFNSQQLVHPQGNSNMVFIHTVQNQNQQIYSKLKISRDCIVRPQLQKPQTYNEVQYYVNKLKQMKNNRILLLHERSMSQQNLMQILVAYISFIYETSQLSTKQYIARSLPNVVITTHTQLVKISKTRKSIQGGEQKTNNEPPKNVQEFYKLFKEHCSESNLQKTERAYNLLSKLLANIINQEEDNYRRVKGANKQMEQLLTRSKPGVSLLQKTGFNEQKGFWVNELQVKYLKVLRTDMDLGYKNFTTEIEEQL